MRLLIAAFALSLAVATALQASQQHVKGRRAPAASSEQGADRKTEREILKVESQFREAMTKCNVALLDRLLADYYADSFEGTNQAVGKRGTLARCKGGDIRYYSIDEKRKISISVDIVTIEGMTRSGPQTDDRESRREVTVKRLWTKKDGRWQLIAQTVGSGREESER
jgi:hypothetical protein